VKHVAQDLRISAGGLQKWMRQDRIDRGEIPGTSSTDSTELVRPKRHIRELEQELEIIKGAAKLLGGGCPAPKRTHPVIDELVEARFPTKVCCQVLRVSSPGHYKYRSRPISPTHMRRRWLTGLIREVHEASRGTYGSRRIRAELTMGMGVVVSDRHRAKLKPRRECPRHGVEEPQTCP